jgi:ABC-2 type transport system permease protein
MTAFAARFGPGGLVGRFKNRRPILPGISAILVKDLRGRMRGRRAFITMTIYLLLLAGFGWMIERLSEQSVSFSSCPGCGGSSQFASASVGRGVFVGILMLQTLIVAVFAPASTAGAISGEREHQTLDLLAVTPISSLAIVLGKLLSALAWMFVLVIASIPITGLVFLFGGVAMDDLLRGYVVVLATAIGMGSVGIFFSSLLKRTGASTGLTFIVVIALAVGTVFLYLWSVGTSARDVNGQPETPPQVILWLNPFVAQADVACGTEGGFGQWCSVINTVVNDPGLPFGQQPGFNGGGIPPQAVFDANGNPLPVAKLRGQPDIAVGIPQADTLRDRFWPRTVLSFLVLGTILTLWSVQLVSPTRRWRPDIRGGLRAFAGRFGPGSVAAATPDTTEAATPDAPGAPISDAAEPPAEAGEPAALEAPRS